ncbi:MAG: hypothetical protein H7A55_17700 [Verrucomicrobiaceae bacterium]|nr:hypothetical protein [Verrucomicrobiaceae bacterium]
MSADCHSNKVRLELVYANLILRLWVGLRLFLAGVDKFRSKTSTTFSMENLKSNMTPIYNLMADNTFLPSKAVAAFCGYLPYALLFTGAWILIGLFSRTALLLGGLVFVSLSVGLMALPDDDAVLARGIEVMITAFALATCGHNKISLDGIFFRGKKCCAATTEDQA